MAISLTIAEFKNTCGSVDATLLSNRNDEIIQSCLDRSEIKINSYFIQASKTYDNTDDATSAVVMYYAIYLLYQRADISQKAQKWRVEAFEILEGILGQVIQQEGNERDAKAITYVSVSETDASTDWLEGF